MASAGRPAANATVSAIRRSSHARQAGRLCQSVGQLRRVDEQRQVLDPAEQRPFGQRFELGGNHRPAEQHRPAVLTDHRGQAQPRGPELSNAAGPIRQLSVPEYVLFKGHHPGGEPRARQRCDGRLAGTGGHRSGRTAAAGTTAARRRSAGSAPGRGQPPMRPLAPRIAGTPGGRSPRRSSFSRTGSRGSSCGGGDLYGRRRVARRPAVGPRRIRVAVLSRRRRGSRGAWRVGVGRGRRRRGQACRAARRAVPVSTAVQPRRCVRARQHRGRRRGTAGTARYAHSAVDRAHRALTLRADHATSVPTASTVGQGRDGGLSPASRTWRAAA